MMREYWKGHIDNHLWNDDERKIKIKDWNYNNEQDNNYTTDSYYQYDDGSNSYNNKDNNEKNC